MNGENIRKQHAEQGGQYGSFRSFVLSFWNSFLSLKEQGLFRYACWVFFFNNENRKIVINIANSLFFQLLFPALCL